MFICPSCLGVFRYGWTKLCYVLEAETFEQCFAYCLKLERFVLLERFVVVLLVRQLQL